MRDKRRLDAVSRQPDRAALQQRFGRDAQHRLEKIDGGVAPQRTIQALAESDSCRRRVTNRRGDKFAAAKLEECSVADSMERCPGQDADRIGLRYPFPEDLARLVPVDQKDQRCADVLQKSVAAGAAVERKASNDKVKGAVVAEADRALSFKSAPLNGEIAE